MRAGLSKHVLTEPVVDEPSKALPISAIRAPEAATPSQASRTAEFDRYGERYYDLLSHPAKSFFARSPHFFATRKWQVLKSALDRFHIDTRTRAWLDVGCGWGELLRLGESDFRQAVGCDVSMNMLAQARGLTVSLQRAPDVLPFPSAVFDLVTTVCVYHHLICDDLRKLLIAESKRVLKEGGILCIMEHNPFNPVTRLIVKQTPLDAAARLVSASELFKLLSEAGLHVVAKYFFLFVPEGIHNSLPLIERCFERIPLGGQYAIFAEKRA